MNIYRILYESFYSIICTRFNYGRATTRRPDGVGARLSASDAIIDDKIYVYIHMIYFVLDSFPPYNDEGSQYRLRG